MSLTRRDLIKTGVFAGAAVGLPAAHFVTASSQTVLADSKLPAPFSKRYNTNEWSSTNPLSIRPPVAKPVRSDATCDYYRMEMKAVQAEIIPGFKSWVFAYGGPVYGSDTPVWSVPGPTIRAKRVDDPYPASATIPATQEVGKLVCVRHCNTLPAVHPILGYEPWTSVHLHGSASLPEYDGYASDITRPGEFKDYHYPNFQKARTLWYHDHGVHHTAENAYHGLAAQYHLRDNWELSRGLPTGKYDVPITVHDAMFRSDGNLLFSLDDQSGHWGNVILVNGKPWPQLKVERRKYRFRILDASISRSFKFYLKDVSAKPTYTGNVPYQVIATDAGLMPSPVTVTSHRQLGGERYEIVVDFSKFPAGSLVNLMNLSPTNNKNFTNTDKVMQFYVSGDVFDSTNNSVPTTLCNENDIMKLTLNDVAKDAAGKPIKRSLRLERSNGAWTVNGTTWDKIVQSGYEFVEANPTEGTVELWEIQNSSGGWFHPLHIHLVDFQVLSRNGGPRLPHEAGPKDVVYTGENETIQLLVKFDGCGKYMVHCHNLIHEDHDMMTQFRVTPADPGHLDDDPLCAPACALTEEWQHVL